MARLNSGTRIYGNATIDTNLVVSGTSYGVLGSAGFANAATVTTLSANGNVTASAITVNNSATVGGTLGVTGNITTTTGNVMIGTTASGASYSVVANNNAYAMVQSVNGNIGSLGLGFGQLSNYGAFMTIAASGGKNFISTAYRDFYIAGGNGNLLYINTSSNSNVQVSYGLEVNNSALIRGNLNVGGNIVATNFTTYDLDDISNYVDGFKNSFRPTYNQTTVSVASPWNLMVSINGLMQPAFQANADVFWQSQVLTANKGYTIDQTTGNIKFADSVPAGAQVQARVVAGSPNTVTKKYPFKPLDILMGY